jgi:glycosyltransferase involved in cell wall biosynthesis
MSSKKVFVLVPSLNLTGPIKGAIALCNGLSDYFQVVLVYLKPASPDGLIINSNIKVVSLDKYKSWKKKTKEYKRLLTQVPKDSEVVSISLCFSADVINSFMHSNAYIMSSVRSNLNKNYYFDYGWLGIILAYVHYFILKRFHHVIAMSDSMMDQLKSYRINRLDKIHNFIDEGLIKDLCVNSMLKSEPFKFIFLGSLSRRKRPELVVAAIEKLRKKGVNCCLDIVGDGPMRSILEKQVKTAGISSRVCFHGNQQNPYPFLQSASCMVLPSESEGISRAILEALFLGLPCIVRDVDGNRELIKSGFNGDIFIRDEELIDVMYHMTQHDFLDKDRHNMLPDDFRQEANIKKYYELIDKL